MKKAHDSIKQKLGDKAIQSSDQLLAMTEQELIRAETELEEAIAHLGGASRMNKKAMEMVGWQA